MANIALYEAGTTDFFSQGMGVLSDVISSTSTETASTTGNESSKLELQYPVGGFLANKLTEGRFVRVSRSIDSSDYAIFEITDTLRDDSGVITVYGTPYSDRLGRMSFENGGKFKEYHSVQVALDAAKAQMKGFPSWFHLTSDLSQAVDFTKDQPYENFSKFLEALNKKVGGNIYYGLTNIRIYSKRGTDRTDIVLRDDLNTKAIKVKTDYTKIVNRIIPLLPVKDEKGNDTQETKVGKIVESGYANKFIDYWAGTVIQVKTQDEANTYFNRTKIDRPTQTVTVDPIELDIDLSDVKLFDQISVYSSKLDFTNKLRVSERTVDNLTGEVRSFKLGNTSPSIVASIVQSNQDIFNQIKEIGNSVISANGKNQLFFGSAKPRNPHEGDLWYKEVDGESYMMVYHNGEWVEVISTKFKDLLDKQISDVLQSSKEYSDNLNTAIASEVGKIKSDVNTQLQTAKTERDELGKKADAIQQDVNTRLEAAALDRKKLSDESKQLAKTATDHAEDLFTQANTNAKTEAQNALQSANEALEQAKKDLNGGISNVHSETVKNAKLIAGKVSQSDYNTKTAELDSKVGTVQLTAEKAALALESYKKTADGNISANKAEIAAANNLIKQKVSQSDYNARTKTVDNKMGQFSIDMEKALTQISEVSSRVNDMKQINLLSNTDFTPDTQGWDTWGSSGLRLPYKSSLNGDVGAITIGFNTQNVEPADDGMSIAFDQTVPLGGSAYNSVVSLGWRSYLGGMGDGMYGHVFLIFRDKDNNILYNKSDNTLDMADWITRGQDVWERKELNNISVPHNTVAVTVRFQVRQGILAYLAQPILVTGPKVGSYIAGNYNNNARVASVEVALDGITELVKDPKNGLSAVRTLAANGQTLAIEARDKANANAKSITKVTETANGTQTTVSKMNGQVSELETKQTQTAKQVTTEIKDRKSGDKAVETAMKNLVSTQITSVTEGYKSLNNQTAQSFNTKIEKLDQQYNSLGQINHLRNTEFVPDLEGWSTSESSTGVTTPYRQYMFNGSNMLTFDTRNQTTKKYASIKQVIPFATSGSNRVVSLSWWSRIATNANNLYGNCHIRSYDSKMNKLSDVVHDWDKSTSMTLQTFENVSIPDGATTIAVTFAIREGMLAFVAKPMLTYQKTVGLYVQGVYDNSNKVESNRTQLVNMIQDKVEDYTKKIEAVRTTTAKQITDEVKDRKNGDSTVTTKLSTMIDERARSLKNGYESYSNQQAQSIIFGIEQTNKLLNTDFKSGYDGWTLKNPESGTGSPASISITNGYKSSNGFRINSYSKNVNNADAYYSICQDVPVPRFINKVSFKTKFFVYATMGGSNDYFSANIIGYDSNNNQTGALRGGSIIGQYNGHLSTWLDSSSVFEDLDVPASTSYIRIKMYVRGRMSVNISQPMLVFNQSYAGIYTPGSYSDVSTNTVLSLLKDKWSIGIADNANKLISGINGDRSGLAIIAKKVTISQDTVVQGKSWLNGAVMKDASISRAKIGKLNVSDADIINVNVDKLSGNKANFIETNARRMNASVLYGNTGHITTVDTGLIINKQDDHLQLSSKGQYNASTKRAQFELLGYASNVDKNMQGSLNYYKNPHNKGTGLGIRMVGNQILAIDEAVATGNLYLSPYASGQVQVVNRNRHGFQDIKASKFVVSSERKYKSNIKPFTKDALSIINGLNVQSYVKSDKEEIGLIADETTSLVLDQDEKGVDLYSLISVMSKAIQELSNKVEELSK